MKIKIPAPSLIAMMVTIPAIQAQDHSLVPGATAWDDVSANWSNPANQLVVYPNATSTNAFISGPRTVTTTVPRTVGRLTLTNSVVLSGQHIVVWQNERIIGNGSSSTINNPLGLFPGAVPFRVEGGLRFNGHLNAAGAVVLMENSDIKLGQAGRLDAARVDVGTQPGVSNFVISFLDMLPGAAVQTSGDFRIGIHPGGRGIVTANQPSIHVGGNLVLGGPGNADFNVDGGSVFVNGYMSFADTSVFGFGLPNVSATLRNTTLTVADSGGPGMRGEYFAGEGDVGVNPTIWFPGTRIRVRPGGFLTVGARISLGVNNTIIDTTGGDAVITGRLWGKALIKEGPGIVKLTRDNRNGGGGQGTLDGLIVRGGFVEFQTSDNLNDGGFVNYAANVNQPPTGLKNIQLNGGGLRWAAGSTEDISARLRLLNNFSFDTNGNNIAFDTPLAGTGGMTKWGEGTLRLAPSNSYTGGTTVRAGMVEFTSLSTFGTGNVTLDGGGLRWSTRSVSDISARLAPLGAGGGTLETNGNTVTLAAAAITGAGSLTKAGAGTLNIQGTHPWAGSLQVVGGALNLSGTFLGKQNLLVGGTGGASLALAAGTQLATTSHARIGHAAGAPGAATVSGANASLSAGDYLEIGSVASGSLHVSHGGRVSSATTTALGVLPGSVGTVEVTHPSSRLDVGTALLVGYLSTGILTVADGGTVEVGDVVELGSQFGGSGVLVVENGGTLRVGGANGIRKGAGASGFNLNGGMLQVIGGELTTSHPITLSQISTIDTQGLKATLGGILSGAGGISKTGGGILHLTAANTHAGGTQVHGGQIIVPSGSALGAGAVGIFNGTLHATGNLSLDQAVTVAGGGSSLTAAGFMEFGLNAASALAVSGGAQVTAPGSVAFGLQAAGIGQADVVGEGSWLACGDVMYVGYIGQGGVNVGSGGTVSVGSTLLLAAGASANATFNLNPGGTLNIGGTNGIAKGAGTANFNFAGGLLKVTGSSLTTTVPMTLSGIPTVDTSGVEATFGGALSGAGNLVKTGAGTLWLTGANNLTGSLVHWAGTVRVTTPGGLPTGPLALNGGTLYLDFGDTASVQSLGFDGAVQTGGLWGGMDSVATYKTPRITGPGMINVLSSSFPPAFNEATRVGLKQMIGAGTLDLLSTTGVSPIGGSFSGPGVSGNAFDPTVAGFGIHTITYTVGGQSAAFTISVIGGLILEQEGGSFGPNNLAPGGTAFAKDVLNHPSHSIAGLNNAQYGNSGSWIADTPGSHAGVALGAPHLVNRIAFGRDNTGAFTDRAATFYLVQYTTDGDPASPAATWTSLGAVDYREGGTPGISAPAARHLFRFPAVTATGLRVIPTDAGTAIDEIEIYPATGLFPIGGLTLLQEGGALASGNLAQAGTAFAQNEIGVGSHAIAKVNDGLFGNASSWIGGTGNSFVGINLGVSQTVSRIAFGRDNSGAFVDRAFGRYTVQYTTAANPDASTPDGQWTTLGTLDYQSAGGPMFAEPHRRHLYGFPAVMATGLRIVTASAVDFIGIDEIEIYQASAALAMSRDGGLPVPVGSTVAFGSSHAGDPVGKTFTLANAGTDTLSFSSFAITGGASGDFLVTPPGTTALAPGQITTFTVTFTPSIVGTRAATLQFTTNDPSHTGATLDLTGSGLAPTFNTATTQGLSFPKGAAAVDLATATGATPAGGTFSGPNVAGGTFDPGGLGFGLHTLSYTRNGVTANFRVAIIGGMDLFETGGSASPANLAPGGTAFAFDEIGAGPHAIAKLNDGLYGNANSWIAGSGRSFAGIALSPTPVVVNRIAFGRDNTGGFLDRARGAYILQYTTEPDPANADNGFWTDIGAVDTRAMTDPHLRRLFAFPAVAATGLRLVTETDSDFTGIDEIEIYNTLSPLESWRLIHFGTTANNGDAEDNFDFDNDGVANLIEFAFGLDPKNPTERQLPAPLRVNENLEVRFTQPPGVSGVIFGAEWSTTLEEGDWQAIPNSGDAPEHLFQVPTMGRDKLFFRHRITRP